MTWRETSRKIIYQFKKDHPELSGEELRKAASKEYPFGVRKHYPYKAWLLAMDDVLGPSEKKRAADRKKIKELPLFREGV